MRALPILLLFALSACTPTTSELFVKANNSGDWTAVNARLELEDEATQALTCRDGFVLVCGGSQTASCSCEQTYRFDDRQREHLLHRGKKYRY